MAWHKQKAYDPTDAFIQNDRQQKLLEIKLDGIDKLWFSQLKNIARERLEVTADLTKIESEKQKLKYYDSGMDIQDLRDHSEEMSKKLKKNKTEARRDNYNFDHMKDRTVTVPLKLQLPRLSNKMSKCSVGKSHKKKKQTGSKIKRKTKLKATRIYSVSDSNLHKSFLPEYKNEQLTTKSVSTKDDDTKSTKSKATSQDNFSNVTDKYLPLLQLSGENKAEDHRFLRQKMATSLALPPLTEVPNRRKLSV